eukprot:6954428-Ditylum_brightwellii.AAC.1
MVANGSPQIQGIDFDMSYSPTNAFDNIRMIIAIAAAENMIIYSLGVSNTFQTNIEEKLYERVCISIPLFYLDYFFGKWPDYPLLGTPANELCLQGLKSIQGTKPTGHKWSILLSCILVNDLKIIQSTSDNSIFSWQNKGHQVLIAVSTDDLLMAATDRTLFGGTCQCFDNHFNYTCTK